MKLMLVKEKIAQIKERQQFERAGTIGLASNAATSLQNLAGDVSNKVASISDSMDIANMNKQVNSVLQDIHQSL